MKYTTTREARREWARIDDTDHATEQWETDHVGTTGEEEA